MLNRFLWCISFLWVVAVSVNITTLTVHAHQQNAQSSPPFINGFPVQQGWKDGTFKPPFLTTDQLVQKETLQTLIDKEEITNLLYAFVFFHDTGNTLGMRSTFTKDGGIGGGYNNEGKQLEGQGCIGKYEQVGLSAVDTGGKMPPPGQPQVAYPFPGHSKNITTNLMIQVHGDTAELHAYYTRVHANVEGEAPVAEAPRTATVMYTGQYVADLRRTPEGWRFVRQWHVNDWRPARGTASERPCLY